MTEIAREDRTEQVEPGRYFIRVNSTDDDKIPIGTICLVTEVSRHRVNFSTIDLNDRDGTKDWYSSWDEFIEQWEYDPDGRAKRDKWLHELIAEAQV